MPRTTTDLSPEELKALNDIENREWIESLEYVLTTGGTERTARLLRRLLDYARQAGVRMPGIAGTPQVNTLRPDQEVPYPGDAELERKLLNLIRWNSVVMVVRANAASEGIGGHLASFASTANLFEVGLQHFFRGYGAGADRDLVYFQGHSATGLYGRAFLEGRLDEASLGNFRRELQGEPGLSSYPHPWLMPDFWEFSTVSMGLGPIMSLYQARFNRYLENRGLRPRSDGKVWAFLGDGEMDEPESKGAITIAVREELDNLIWVVNCNLQRLDGPVRGNGNIVRELEGIFAGAGWNVIKVLWGERWQELLERDRDGALVQRFEEVVDGWWQTYVARGPEFFREHFFSTPELERLIEGWSDGDLEILLQDRGGHDPAKIYNAYRAATEHRGGPTVILAQTIKGYALGSSVAARNTAHQVKKLDPVALRELRDRLELDVSDDELVELPFLKPEEGSPELRYLRERREALGGPFPERRVIAEPLQLPGDDFYEEFHAGTEGREVSTTMAFVRLLSKAIRDPEIGRLIVPIIPDEARTFGMEALFRLISIYDPHGQKYEPVDRATLLYYKEAEDGQILEEGLTEAGAMSSFIAAGVASSTVGVNTIPFYIYYSMFGYQRVGDLVWAAADMRAKGFLIGATAGRTTLAGEGLQHQDGHSHVLFYAVPNLKAYDPAFAYEIAVIVQEGMRRMYGENEELMYYLTVTNEDYAQPAAPAPIEELREGILRGLYRFRASGLEDAEHRAQLFGSGSIMNEVLAAQEILERYGVAADVWSVTSYGELHRDALQAERHNRLHPDDPRTPWVREALADAPGVFVAAHDYLKILPDALARHLPKPMIGLGTDGFGRSEAREDLRRFFEVDAASIALATLRALADEDGIEPAAYAEALRELGIDPDKPNPYLA